MGGVGVELSSGGLGEMCDCRFTAGRKGDRGGRGGDGRGVVEGDAESILDLGVSEKLGGGPAMPTRRERGSLLGEGEVESAIEVIWFYFRGGVMCGLSGWCQKRWTRRGYGPFRHQDVPTLFCAVPSATSVWYLRQG